MYKGDKRPRTGNTVSQDETTGVLLEVPQLSNELIARIIDFLDGDGESLRTCTLVSYSLLHPARKLLHHHAFVNIRNCCKFLEALNASPNLGSYVRELHVFIQSSMDQEDSWVDKYLPLIASKLPNVVHLELKGDKNGRYKAAPFQALKSVRRCSMHATQVHDMNELCAMIGMFPHLEEIYAHDLFVFRSPEVTVKPSSPPNMFKRASFNSCRLDPVQIADWMCDEGLFDNMEYLSVCPLQQVGVPPVGKLLAASGPAMKHFKLALVGMRAQGGFVDLIWDTCRLSQNTELRVIEFGSPAQFANLYGSDDKDVSWFSTMLSTITSKNMEEVIFNLWGGDIDNPTETGDLEMIGHKDWDAVVDVLSSAPFRALGRVTFHVAGVSDNAVAISDTIKRRFQLFDDAGILFIDSKEDLDCR